MVIPSLCPFFFVLFCTVRLLACRESGLALQQRQYEPYQADGAQHEAARREDRQEERQLGVEQQPRLAAADTTLQDARVVGGQSSYGLAGKSHEVVYHLVLSQCCVVYHLALSRCCVVYHLALSRC